MKDLFTPVKKLPREQEFGRAKCFYPTGTFVDFEKESRAINPAAVGEDRPATSWVDRRKDPSHPSHLPCARNLPAQFPLRAVFESDRREVSCPNQPNPGWPLRSGNGVVSGRSGIGLGRESPALARSSGFECQIVATGT